MARVLVIDDSPDMLAMLRLFFERRTSHEVQFASNGKEGLGMASDRPPDLALVDVMMPGMDGYEVVRRLRSQPETQDIGIIILTARGQPVDEAAALQAGADMHLSKPVNIDVLSGAVSSLLEKAKQSRAPRVVVPVLGLRGGVGATTMAVNLAVLLQQQAPTALWDLSPASGHAALLLGIQPRTHWGFYLRDSSRAIPTLLREHRTGLQLLAAPPVPNMFGWFSEKQAGEVLDALTEVARFVVIDMPPMLGPAVEPILDRADKPLLVTGDDPPAIQTTLATLQALQRWQVRPIVVHNASRPGKAPDVGTLERAMRINIHHDVPHDAGQRLTLSKGTPLAESYPESPLVKALKPIAQSLLSD